MGEPIRNQQGVKPPGLAVVKADHKFATVWAETLQRMRLACRKIPQITLVNVRDVWPALGVENRHAAAAISHDRPLSGLMPVQFPDAPGCQPHVDARDRVGNREIFLRHFARPTAVLDTLWCIVE